MTFAWDIVGIDGVIIKSGNEESISHAIGVILSCIHERGSSMIVINRSAKYVSGFSSDGKLFWKVEV